MSKPALLMLDDGTCFEGQACGAAHETAGEVVFTTGMCGYQETLTDPSFHGQIITFTSAHVGNYGTSPQDNEASLPRAAGAVFHDLFNEEHTNVPHWRATESLNTLLARAGIPGISGVDTRALTLHLRKRGTRNGVISALDLNRPSLLRRAKELPAMAGRDLAIHATCKEPYTFADGTYQAPPGPRPRVAVIDYGVKRSILLNLARQNMDIQVWPATVSARQILASGAHGVLLSNGPGDPEACTYAVKTIEGLLGRLPLFGICLGHQLLGLALGARAYKLPFGHHGANHPVKDLFSGQVHITSQNHGFCLHPASLPANVCPSHQNLNDETLEGLVATDLPAFSVQFHPEAAPGPSDARGLFKRFAQLIRAHAQAEE